MTQQPWYNLSAEKALAALSSTPDGLAVEEIARRRETYGFNRLPPPARRSALRRFAEQFNNLLIYVLLAAAAVTASLTEWVDTGVIIGVVVINALIGFIQEGKAEHALEAIAGLLSPQAVVKRGGRLITIPAEELVPGDIVLLAPGDRIPADLRLLAVRDLSVDESLLTGESLPVDKHVTAVAEDTVLAERSCMVWSGTLVTYGQGTGIVAATGSATEIGRISRLLADVQTLTTPLLRRMNDFARWLTGAILGLAALTFVGGYFWRDYGAVDMFMAAVGLAVAAIPEGLPAIMTITLAIGVQRMASRNAIIRQLPAVETLGSVTVICSDKTGTLTHNEMSVQGIVAKEIELRVTGSGYDPHGELLCGEQVCETDRYPVVEEIARAGLLCNDADLHQAEDGWRHAGDPTEVALITLAHKAGLEPDFERENWPRTDVIPFAAEYRYMATLHHDHSGHGFIYLKGAPEVVLPRCAFQREAGEDESIDRDFWQASLDHLAAQGQRVLALAFKVASDTQRELDFDDVEGGLTLLGLTGLADPPRAEAIEAVARCHQAGVRVKMITGDHAATARAIGMQMGIGDGENVLTEESLCRMDDDALQHAVEDTDVFARVSPEQKLRLVQALQGNGHVVAMTGDGVNDAPALKRADVGTAMGLKGTDAAKQAAEMVLADDNFASIAAAVEEGRTIYDNIKKSILFILPTNAAEAMVIVAAILMGRLLPITAVQILWVNMITAVTLALSLAFEPPEHGVMRRPPRNPGEPLLSRFLIWRIVFVAAILVAGVFGLFLWERGQGASIEYARTIAVNTLVMFEAFYLLNTRYIREPVLSWHGLFDNPYVWIAIVTVTLFQLLYTYFPPMQLLFSTQPITLEAWGRIVLVSASVFVLVELEKFMLPGHSR
ncbi:MAG: cation-transporting P-type ATPase [Gammaproteobacteria bacterium]|jgi:magnesium-transporting ATPase (P-type)